MAKVDETGRVILYHVGGKPVYADETPEVDQSAPAEKKKKKKTGGRTYGDDTPDPKKDEPKDKPKDKESNGKYAKTILVRGKDGRLNVQYVDAKTNRPIPKGLLKNYETISAANDLSDIYNTPKDKADSNKDKVTTPVEEPKKPTEPRNKFRDMPGTFSSTGGIGSKQSPSASPGGVSTNNTNSEQGDTDQQYDPSKTKDFREGISTNPNVAPDDSNSPDTDIAQSTPSLDSYDATTGNKYSSLEGQDLSKQTTVSSTRNWNQSQIDDAAKTLAGEIDSRITDINSPEAQDEANGIMSTIENRALKAYDGDISKAIHAPNQYSTWNNDEVASNAEKNFAANPDKYRSMVTNYQADPTSNKGYTHYQNPSIADANWADNMKLGAMIGPHQFYTSPEYSIDQHPLTTDEQNTVATGIINQNILNSPMTALGAELTSAAPEVQGIAPSMASMSTGMQAQRDDLGGIGSNPSWGSPSTTGMAPGMQASRDLNSIDTGANLGVGMTAQRDFTGPADPNASPSGLAAGIAAEKFGDQNRWGPTPNTPMSFASIPSAQTIDGSTPTQNVDQGRFASTQEQGGSLAQGLAAQRTINDNYSPAKFGSQITTDPAAAGPSYDATTGFAAGYQPSISPSPAGVYGDPTGGFTQGTPTADTPDAANNDAASDVGAAGTTGNDTTGGMGDHTIGSTSGTPGTSSTSVGGTTGIGSSSTGEGTDTGADTSAGPGTSVGIGSPDTGTDTDTEGGGSGGGFGGDDGY